MRTAAGFVALLGAWWAASASGLVNPMFLASPGEVAASLVDLARSGSLAEDLGSTFRRVLAGLGLSALVGIPLGLGLGFFQRGYRYVEGALDFLRSIPPIVVFPLCLLILGITDASRVAVVVFGCTTVLLMHLAAGVAQIPPARIAAVRALGASPFNARRAELYLVRAPEGTPLEIRFRGDCESVQPAGCDRPEGPPCVATCGWDALVLEADPCTG